MRIQHNIMAMNAYRNYSNNTSALSANLEKLSSGYKINRAGDDAAGLAISEKMRAQITGLDQATDNVKDGISLVKTAEGALQEVQDMMNRMVELATQSANGTYDDSVDRANLQAEVDALQTEIDRIADSANFNGISLLDGSLESSAVQVATTDGGSADDKLITDDVISSTIKANTPTLHTEGTEAAVGTFTVDVSQLSIAKDGTNKTAIKFTIGGADVTIETADATTDWKASDIATALASKLDGTNGALVVDANGKLNYTEDGAYTAAKGDLMYTATADAANGTVTFTTAKVCSTEGTATGIAGTGAAWTALTNNKPDASVADKAVTLNLNLDVAAEVTTANGATVANANTLYGKNNVGTISYTNADKDKPGTLGNAKFDIDLSKLEEGTTMSILGDEKKITLDGSTTGADIDLSGLDLTTAAGKAEAKQRIANAYGTSNDNVTVGVNASGLFTISEKGDPSKVTVSASTVTDAAKEAMSTEDGFNAIVSFKAPGQQDARTLSNADTFVREGGSVQVGTKTFTFTRDPSSATAKDDTTYVAVDDGLDGLKAAIENAFGSDIGGIDNNTTDNTFVIHFAEGVDGLDVSYLGGKGLTLQIGDTSESYNQLEVSINDMHAAALGVSGSQISISSAEDAQAAVSIIKNAINQVSSTRGKLGATQNRLEHTSNNLSVMAENIQDAESTIRDTDIAEEMMSYTKNNILVQSAQAMLAQANQVPQGVLQLLQ